jgi:predicted anti-sigma-YlaC factor YlaD
MLTCQQMTEVITTYLEGQMPLGQRIRFQLHVGMCKHCRAYLKQMKSTVQTLGRLPDEAMPPEIEAELLQRFRSWRLSEQPPRMA